MKINIREEIITHKRKEVSALKQRCSARQLESSFYFDANTISLRNRLLNDRRGIIAEFKRRAPSSGILHKNAWVTSVVKGYADAGAVAVSVLTDQTFFGACRNDLQLAAAVKTVPLLRKDFILEEYQVLEAKAMGADAVLLIAGILTRKEIRSLSMLAHLLGLEVLLEIHHLRELEKLCDTVDLIGVNNRNLETFETNPDHGINLLPALPKGIPVISESGIRNVTDAARILDAGFNALLIGTQFMKAPKPEKAFEVFRKALIKREDNLFCNPIQKLP